MEIPLSKCLGCESGSTHPQKPESPIQYIKNQPSNRYCPNIYFRIQVPQYCQVNHSNQGYGDVADNVRDREAEYFLVHRDQK